MSPQEPENRAESNDTDAIKVRVSSACCVSPSMKALSIPATPSSTEASAMFRPLAMSSVFALNSRNTCFARPWKSSCTGSAACAS